MRKRYDDATDDKKAEMKAYFAELEIGDYGDSLEDDVFSDFPYSDISATAHACTKDDRTKIKDRILGFFSKFPKQK